MKKFAAMMMALVILTMSLVVAQGETKFHTVMWNEKDYCKIDADGSKHYYVLVTRDSCDYTCFREVSRTMYYELLAEEQRDVEKAENAWYNKAWKWTKGAATDVADFVVFWN